MLFIEIRTVCITVLAGLAAHDLYDALDFDAWFTSHLIGELSVTEQRFVRTYMYALICSFSL